MAIIRVAIIKLVIINSMRLFCVWWAPFRALILVIEGGGGEYNGGAVYIFIML